MSDFVDYSAAARDVMEGKRVVVFCDNMSDARRAFDEVRGHLVRYHGAKPEGSRSRRSLRAGDGTCRFALGENDTRGLRADAVYPSRRAAYQLWFSNAVANG